MNKELEFKRWFRGKLAAAGVWSEAFEPTRGTSVGTPDCLVLFGKDTGGINPSIFVELKVGKIEGDKLFVTEIRASQYSWHKHFQYFGGISCFAVGVKNGKDWDIYILPKFDQDEFMKFCKIGSVELKRCIVWPNLNCTFAYFQIIKRFLSLS